MSDVLTSLLGYDLSSPLLFTSFYFWIFFLLVFSVAALLGRRITMRNIFLCAVSFFFYYKSGGLSVLILLVTVVSCFFCGKWMVAGSHSMRRRNTFLMLGLLVNLGALCYFKYSYFFVNLLNDLFGLQLHVVDVFAWVGNLFLKDNHFSVDNIILPVGISFFVFQGISYLMDIYRNRIRPLSSILDFGFYVSFFPQLVAGPIVRASTFIPQMYKPFFLGRRQFGVAIFWILNGLAKKIILSDYIAVNFIDRVFTNPDMFSGFETLWALFGYSLQVYADFSGYTDIATGVAMLLGFYLPQNFNSPYKAPNPGNFWKRWHISLSQWLQDYLYIPLGGNRNDSFGSYCTIISIALIATILSGFWWVAVVVTLLALAVALWIKWASPLRRKKITTNINSMDTMLLGGLWHGASWNFVIWGGLNGVGMVIFKFWRNRNVYQRCLIIYIVFLLFVALTLFYGYAPFILGAVWTGVIFLGTFFRMCYNFFGGLNYWRRTERVWAVAQTFVFITFTRLFFRSGSNLDPALANKTAWETAKTMINQMAFAWNVEMIPDILMGYRYVFLLIIIGMVIHWLPAKFKQRYRINFAYLPLPVMALVTVLVIFIVYQFMTADLQKFIYFQF